MGWESVMLAAARAAAERCDVRVVERSGWKTRGHANVGSLQGTLWHDTVTPYSWSDDKLGGLLSNGYSGLPGPIANVGIGTGGNIILIAGRKAHHAGTGSWSGISSGNSNTIGIEVQNPGRPTPWRDIQLTVVRAFVEEVHRRAGLSGSKAIGHKDWASGRKVDPWSVDMSEERRRLTRALAGAPEPEVERSWFEMATKTELRQVVKEEVDLAVKRELALLMEDGLGGRNIGHDMSRLRRSVRAIADNQGMATEHPVEPGYKVDV